MRMVRLVLAAGIILLCGFSSFAQLKKFYVIKETASFDTVDFNLKAARGNTYIKNYAASKYPMAIYGNPDLERINPSFKTKFKGNTCHAFLHLDAYNSFNFGDGFSFVMSKETKEEDGNYWKVLVNDDKIYRFHMKYGVGNTELDLSNIRLNHMHLNSGSANVTIGYDKYKLNLIEMDTFSVKVDLGSLVTKNLANARASKFMADVGFGTATLDFSGKEATQISCDAKIGAGSLDVLIPSRDTPVIIYIKDSPFCGIRMAEDFEEVEENVFVNHSYSADAKNLMTLDVDVALGTLSVIYIED